MNHLNPEELVDHYYREDKDEAAVRLHLSSCAECASAFAALTSELGAVETINVPDRGPGYGERMWQSAAPALEAYPSRRSGWRQSGMLRGLRWAAACAALAACAFYAGRAWEKHFRSQAASSTSQPAPDRDLVMVVLGDHLDRSERLLVELKHVDPENADMAPPLRDEARSLLASNQACRDRAVQMNDPALAAALAHLNQVLSGLANQGDGANSATIVKLKDDADLENLLFEVRVLRSRLPESRAAQNIHLSGGTI